MESLGSVMSNILKAQQKLEAAAGKLKRIKSNEAARCLCLNTVWYCALASFHGCSNVHVTSIGPLS